MSIVSLVFLVTCLAYATACGGFFVHLAQGGKQSARIAFRASIVAVVAHLGFVAAELAVTERSPLSGIHESLAVLSLLIMLGYLLTMRRHRITSLGAFLTPVTLILFLGAGLQGPLPSVPEHVRSALLPVHVGVNVLGLAAFALAFAAAVAYLVQERLLRSKHVVGVFQRLPALEDLDALGRRLVMIGFPLFTLGVALGTLWAARGTDGLELSAGQGFGMLAWLFFAGVLLLRATGGFSGRRAAIGTMLGFLCAMAAIAGYVLRTSGAS